MRAPAVLPALATIAGVAAGVTWPDVRSLGLLLLVLLIAAGAGAWRAGHDRLLAASLAAGFGAVGLVFGAIESPYGQPLPLRTFFDDYSSVRDAQWPLLVEGRLRSDAMPADYGASLLVEVERVRTPCGWTRVPGGARISVNGTVAPHAIAAWRAGRRLRMSATLRLPTAYRNPGVPDETLSLAARGIALTGSVKSSALVEIVDRGTLAQEAAAAARAYVRAAVRSAAKDRADAASIVTAILIGDRSGLSLSMTRRLQEAGTYHVIAISGGNIAILAGLGYLLLRLARASMRAGSLGLAAVLCAYGYLTGGGPSVARATIAATVYLLAIAADHRSPAANVLAVVALLAVVTEPLEVFDAGLALSYGATLALLVAAERASRRAGSEDAERDNAEERADPNPGASSWQPLLRLLHGLRLLQPLRGLRSSALSTSLGILVGTAAAELALFPVGAAIFNRVTVAGFILNLAAIPLMTVTQLAGIAVLIAHPLSPVLAEAAGLVASIAATWLVESTAVLEVAPWLSWRVPSPPWWILAGYYAGWITVLWCPAPPLWRRAALAGSAVAGLFICAPPLSDAIRPGASPARHEFRVTFLDVGQGDAAVLQFPGGRSMLIDAAGMSGSSFDLGDRVIARALLAMGVHRLEHLVITHGDPDHVLGAASVARDFRPRELWEGIVVPPHAGLRDLQAAVAGRGGSLRAVRPHDRLRIGGVELRVLHPGEPDWERQRVRNDDSIVIEARYGDVSLVLPGDIGSDVERTLASSLSDAPLRILKAAHHGSATSSSADFLAAARPAAVVFSCGRGNRYGHPHATVLARVHAVGAEVFRTDRDGAVTLRTDGTRAEIATVTGRSTSLTTKTTKGTKTTKESTKGSTEEEQ